MDLFKIFIILIILSRVKSFPIPILHFLNILVIPGRITSFECLTFGKKKKKYSDFHFLEKKK